MQHTLAPSAAQPLSSHSQRYRAPRARSLAKMSFGRSDWVSVGGEPKVVPVDVSSLLQKSARKPAALLLTSLYRE